MKWRIWKRPPEWKKISLYAVIILVSLFVCEFAFAARKAKGVTCVKDYSNSCYYGSFNIVF